MTPQYYPTSYYYYTGRRIIAYFVAIVFRHSLAFFSITDENLIMLAGFVIGLTPDFFTLTDSVRAGGGDSRRL